MRHQRPLSLIIFDLDEFKTINDTYGHLCGDFILKQVASLARDLVRPEQVLARVGGDEFVILAPETGGEGAESLASKLRDRVAGYEHRYGDIKIPVSCSFGVAELTQGDDPPAGPLPGRRRRAALQAQRQEPGGGVRAPILTLLKPTMLRLRYLANGEDRVVPLVGGRTRLGGGATTTSSSRTQSPGQVPTAALWRLSNCPTIHGS